ncbi:MAG: thioredoxin family protein [Polyangiaceae bacterium]
MRASRRGHAVHREASARALLSPTLRSSLPALLLFAALSAMGCDAKPKARSRDEDGVREDKARPEKTVETSRVPDPPPPRLPERLPPWSEWPTDVDAALARARAEGRPVLIEFGAEWSSACKELERGTFGDDAFRTRAKRFIPVRVDLTNEDAVPGYQAIVERWRMKSLPLIIVIDSKGAEVRRISEYLGAEELLRLLDPVP